MRLHDFFMEKEWDYSLLPNVPEGFRRVKIDKMPLGLATGQSPWLEQFQGNAGVPRHITMDCREDGLRQAVGCSD